jgi:radical SAM protein with 4Fe4S-binding SPASM domain
MCPYHSEDLRKEHATDYFSHSKRMPTELFDQLILEAAAHGTNLAFGQYDEPFIYKGFSDWVVKAKKAGCGVTITTNGTLLNEIEARKLISANVEHISFSLDAATAETYRKIRLDDFSVPLENMKKLVQVRNEMQGKTSLRACLVIQEHNRHEQSAFRDLMKSIGLDMVSFYVLSKYESGIWVNEHLNLNIDLPDIGNRYACSQLWSQMALYPDGNVALCCATTMYVGYRDDIPYVGNFSDHSLQEIWLSANYRQIRAEALRGVFNNSVCSDCQIWHNYQSRRTHDEQGNLVYENPYETFVYFH